MTSDVADRTGDRKPTGRVHSIQAPRGIAAGMVVFAHAVEHGPGRAAEPILLTGRFGVDLFFVISGFVIIYVAGTGRFDPVAFMRRRLWRVVPLYWALTLVVAFASIVTPHAFQTTVFDPLYLLQSLFFIPAPLPGTGDWRPLFKLGWTLNYEIFFYVLVAALCWCRSLSQRVVVLSAILGTLCMASFMVKSRSLLGFYVNLNLLPFLGGAWLALLWRSGAFARLGRRATLGLVLAAAVTTIAFYQLPFQATKATPGHLLMIASAVAIIAAALSLERAAARLAVCEWLGDISYSLYLSHMFVVGAGWAAASRVGVASSWPGSIAVIVFVCTASLIAAHLIHRWFERPLLRLADARTSSRAIPVTAAG